MSMTMCISFVFISPRCGWLQWASFVFQRVYGGVGYLRLGGAVESWVVRLSWLTLVFSEEDRLSITDWMYGWARRHAILSDRCLSRQLGLQPAKCVRGRSGVSIIEHQESPPPSPLPSPPSPLLPMRRPLPTTLPTLTPPPPHHPTNLVPAPSPSCRTSSPPPD